MSELQQMDTAPDETPVLLYSPAWPGHFVVGERRNIWVTTGPFSVRWSLVDDYEPTGWQPLPSPPETEG